MMRSEGRIDAVRLPVTAALVALAVSAALPVMAAATAPSTLLASPSEYEGKSVSVKGVVKSFQTSKTLMGTVTAYQLCDAKCLVVIDQTDTAHKNGDTVTASGTFQTTFKGPKRTFHNVVVIK